MDALTPSSVLKDGRYSLLELLGEGGMGSVYSARDTRLGRKVALKVLHGELLTHRTARARMEREANALGRIQHRNVVGIYDVFDHEGSLVLVLEFVDGGDLADRLEAAGPMSWRSALGLLLQVLDGLQTLHDAHLVHRDLKPENVLLERGSGTAKLTDLGVAHDAKGQRVTRSGARIGTPEYMSPEQIFGQPVDHRSDIYGAGVLLFELLAGHAPFRGNEFEVQAGHVSTPAPFDELPAAVPSAVTDILARALAKEPGDRYSSASSMASACRAALTQHEATSAAPASPEATTEVVVRGSSRLVVAATAVVAAILAVGITLAIAAAGSADDRPGRSTRTTSSTHAPEPADELETDDSGGEDQDTGSESRALPSGTWTLVTRLQETTVNGHYTFEFQPGGRTVAVTRHGYVNRGGEFRQESSSGVLTVSAPSEATVGLIRVSGQLKRLSGTTVSMVFYLELEGRSRLSGLWHYYGERLGEDRKWRGTVVGRRRAWTSWDTAPTMDDTTPVSAVARCVLASCTVRPELVPAPSWGACDSLYDDCLHRARR